MVVVEEEGEDWRVRRWRLDSLVWRDMGAIFGGCSLGEWRLRGRRGEGWW